MKTLAIGVVLAFLAMAGPPWPPAGATWAPSGSAASMLPLTTSVAEEPTRNLTSGSPDNRLLEAGFGSPDAEAPLPASTSPDDPPIELLVPEGDARSVRVAGVITPGTQRRYAVPVQRNEVLLVSAVTSGRPFRIMVQDPPDELLGDVEAGQSANFAMAAAGNAILTVQTPLDGAEVSFAFAVALAAGPLATPPQRVLLDLGELPVTLAGVVYPSRPARVAVPLLAGDVLEVSVTPLELPYRVTLQSPDEAVLRHLTPGTFESVSITASGEYYVAVQAPMGAPVTQYRMEVSLGDPATWGSEVPVARRLDLAASGATRLGGLVDPSKAVRYVFRAGRGQILSVIAADGRPYQATLQGHTGTVLGVASPGAPLEITVSSPGDYFLTLQAPLSSPAVPFDLSLGVRDDVPPVEIRARGEVPRFPAGIPTLLQGRVTSLVAHDYALTLATPVSLSLDLQSSLGTTRVIVHDILGQEIARLNSPGGLTVSLTEPGDYSLTVYLIAGEEADYRLRVRIQEP